MRISVSAWDPGYADSGERLSDARGLTGPELDVEVPSVDWMPLRPDASAPPPRVLLVDGVRRLDARVDIDVPGQPPVPGLCASYAAGVVVCDLASHSPNASMVTSRVERGLFSSVADAELSAGPVAAYQARRVTGAEPGDLVNAVQERLTSLEVAVAAEAEPADADLLVLDGALRRREHLRRAVGFIKSHQRRYLTDEPAKVVDRLKPGERTPVFLLKTSWQRYTWYIRLPGGGDGSWAGVARLEAAAELPVDTVIGLADASALMLPRLASSAHKDPRAPQNLTPIAGLERMLRAKLGDPRLLLRNLRTSRPVG
ncbi:hypothetical protein LX16_0953 [Stackebrandtia albiflava]|uniref:NurA domain-containing protein n=1 Tax=Stackebrandtia albiflava TaxID=406432 RepID=A0A562VBJ8_9ACTN|nr:DNA double-strand break repair nuclease NurA [Stackebrandtia albiflava]TWJ15253.1 hypothetical protein LX16_0953 [Stackebrandtia albiflava]